MDETTQLKQEESGTLEDVSMESDSSGPIDLDEYILDSESELSERRSPIPPKPDLSSVTIDNEELEAVINLIIQQNAALDNLRSEFDRFRQETKEELEWANKKARLAESQSRTLRRDIQQAVASNEYLRAENSAFKTSPGHTNSNMLALVEHQQIVKHLEDEARKRTDFLEAEKGHIAVQMAQLQIQLAQARNYISERSYAKPALLSLTENIKLALAEQLLQVNKPSDDLLKDLAEAKERITQLESEVEKLSSQQTHRNAINDDQLSGNVDKMSSDGEYDNIQIAEETHVMHSEVGPDVSQVLKERDLALLDNEQLRIFLKEAKEDKEKLTSRLTELTRDAKLSVDMKDQAVHVQSEPTEIQSKVNDALKEIETLKSTLDIELKNCAKLESEKLSLTAELETLRLNLSVKDTEFEAKKEYDSIYIDQNASLSGIATYENEGYELGELLSENDAKPKDSNNRSPTECMISNTVKEKHLDSLENTDWEGESDKLRVEPEARIANQEMEAKIISLENDLKTAHGQLAESRECLKTAQRLQDEFFTTQKKDKMALARAEARVAKLEAARQQMAALFNIPTTSPFTSPLRPHVYGRVTSSTPSSPHDSHSTLFTQSSIPDQDRGSLEPPQKRTRLNKDIGLSIESHPESILPDTVISALVRSDGPLLPAASNPHPTLHGPCTQEQSSLDRDTSSGSQSVTFTPYDSMRAESMFRRTRDWTIYEFFARISSWPAMSGSDVSKCGFCQLENDHTDTIKRPDLLFSPIRYPDAFWMHCLATHGAFMRPDIEEVVSEIYVRDSESGHNASVDISTGIHEIAKRFTELASWTNDQGSHFCGLCELENIHTDRAPLPSLFYNPAANPFLFWGHCRAQHPKFWQPSVVQPAGSNSPS